MAGTNTTVTTLYTLDSVTDSLFIQNPPNAGTQTLGIGVTLGGNPLNFTAIGGFDIPAGVNAARTVSLLTLVETKRAEPSPSATRKPLR